MAKDTHSTSSFCVETLLKSGAIPEAVKVTFRQSLGQITTADELLWREVASRMTLDAFGVTPEAKCVTASMGQAKYTAYRRTVREARNWFVSRFQMADSDAVFAYWGGNADSVRSIVKVLPRMPEIIPLPIAA